MLIQPNTYAVVDKDGIIRQGRSITQRSLKATVEALAEEGLCLKLVEGGPIDSDLVRLAPNGDWIARPAPVPEAMPVTRDMVNTEIEARITARFDPFDQFNALRGARDDVDFAWIDAVREAGRALKAMDPIPPDFKDDKYWPAGESNG